MKNTLIVIAICAVLMALSFFAPAVVSLPFNLIDLALGWLGSFWVVVIVSAVVGLLFIMAFPHVSSQNGIKAVKDRIKYNLLGIRIYQDDMPTVMKSTGGTLSWNFAYLGLNLLPMVVMAGPFMAVWFQLNSLYAFQPLSAGEETVVVCQLRDDVNPADVQIAQPEIAEGVGAPAWSLVGSPVRIAGGEGERWINMTVRAEHEGEWELTYRYRDETISKKLAIGDKTGRLTKVRTATPFADFIATRDPIVFFGEGILPDDAFVQSVFINYPSAPLGPFGGGEITIMLVFVVVSLVVGFGLKGAFGVEI